MDVKPLKYNTTEYELILQHNLVDSLSEPSKIIASLQDKLVVHFRIRCCSVVCWEGIFMELQVFTRDDVAGGAWVNTWKQRASK